MISSLEAGKLFLNPEFCQKIFDILWIAHNIDKKYADDRKFNSKFNYILALLKHVINNKIILEQIGYTYIMIKSTNRYIEAEQIHTKSQKPD